MIKSIELELKEHIQSRIDDGVIDDTNQDEWHFHCFNEDYYIIGYYEAEQWLSNHGLSSFEAIQLCMDYEKDNFGEVSPSDKYNNAESVVNMVAYIYGEEILNAIGADTIEELGESL